MPQCSGARCYSLNNVPHPLRYARVGRGSVVVRTSGSHSRQPGFESSCCRFEALEISFIPRGHSSLSCINEYLATERERGGYLNELSSRSNCSVAECFPENEQVCQGVKCKAILNSPKDWIPRYVTTYLYLFTENTNTIERMNIVYYNMFRLTVTRTRITTLNG